MYEVREVLKDERAESFSDAAVEVLKEHYPDKKCTAVIWNLRNGWAEYAITMRVGNPLVEKSLEGEIKLSAEFYETDLTPEMVRSYVSDSLKIGVKL